MKKCSTCGVLKNGSDFDINNFNPDGLNKCCKECQEVKKEYYQKAMDMFPGYKFKVFSDEIPEAKKLLEGIEGLEWSTNSNEVDDVVELSCCEHQICSPSTFSWAAMWMKLYMGMTLLIIHNHLKKINTKK